MGIPLTFAGVCDLMRVMVQDSRFKASSGWLRGFKKRFGFTLCAPTASVNVTFDLTVVERFQSLFHHLVDQYEYPVDNIINLDETPTWFNQPIRKTVDFVGSKNVLLNKQLCRTASRDRITTVLAVTMGGKMLDPCVIYSSQCRAAREAAGSTGHYLSGIKCYKLQNNTMTSHIIVDYIKNVLSPQFNMQDKKLLIMDSFSGHLTQQVRAVLKDHKFDVLIIPGGYTKYLQPLDISVNRSFKARLKR